MAISCVKIGLLSSKMTPRVPKTGSNVEKCSWVNGMDPQKPFPRLVGDMLNQTAIPFSQRG